MSLVVLAFLFGVTGIASADLVAQWQLDEGEGTLAYDASENHYDGTLLGDPAWIPGVLGFGLELDGDGDYVDMGNPEGLPVGADPGSMTAWGRADSIAGGFRWLAAYGTGSTGQARFLGINGTPFYIGGYAGDNDVAVTDFWELGEWHHVAYTYDGTTAIAYGDGVALGSGAKSWNTVLSRCHIGQQVNDFSEFWIGVVDDVRIYDHTLTIQEIAEIVRAGHQKVFKPTRADEATDVLCDTMLTWTASEDAVAHTVYFGTSAEDVAAASIDNPLDMLVIYSAALSPEEVAYLAGKTAPVHVGF